MPLFSDIIERKNRKEKAANQKYMRELEIKKLFFDTCKKHLPELRQHFSRVKVNSDSISVDNYNLVFSALKTCLYLGYGANSASGEVKIIFDYNWTDVRLILTFRNALRRLVSTAYRPGVKA